MTLNSLSRLSALTMLVSVAGAAHAFNIDLVSQGGIQVINAGTAYTVNESVLFQNGGPSPLTSLQYGGLEVGFPFNGTGSYSDGTATNTFSFNYSLISGSSDAFSNTQSFQGTWVYTGGTGTYAGLMGQGTMTLEDDINMPVRNGIQSSSAFFGALVPVPEPASLATLAVGIGCLVRRRRK